MTKTLLLIPFLLFSSLAFGANELRLKNQVIMYSPAAIGDSNAAAASSVLDVKSTTQGALFPRMTTTQRNAISSPAEGLMIYNTTTHQYEDYNGSAWGSFGLTALGALDGQSPTANGGAVSGSTLYLQSADSTHPGLVNNTTQTFSGDKTFGAGGITITGGAGVMQTPSSTDFTITPGLNGKMTLQAQGAGSELQLGNPTAAVNTGITLTQISTPSNNPASGYDKLYFKSDDSLYSLNPSGGETKIGSGGGGGLYAGGQNLISNNSAEVNTTGVTVSGGSLARVTAAANIVPPGVGAFSWDPSASGQTFSWPSVTVTANDGLSGQNGVMSCAVKTAATDMQMQVYDGSNVLTPSSATDLVPSSGAGFIRYTLNFVFPSSGTLTPRFKSQSNSVIAYIDDCFWGKAEGFNFYLSQISQDWNSTLAFTTNGLGTPTSASFFNKRIGDTLKESFSFVTGTTTASTAYLQLPSGTTLDTTKLSSNVNGTQVGLCTGAYSSQQSLFDVLHFSQVNQILFYDGSTTDKLFFAYRSGATSAQINKDTGSSMFSNGQLVTCQFEVPITEWSGTSQGFKPDQVANSWAGYHDSNCTWTTTGGSFADPAIDASCTLTETNNVNFGTVVSYNDGTLNNNYPGIKFTPSRTGSYYACASITLSQNTINQAVAAQLFDETNSKDLDQAVIDDPTAGNYFHERLCGFINATSTSPISLGIRMRVSAGTGSLASAGADRTIYWNIFQINQSFPAPLLVNSVTSSNSTGVERIERVNFGGAGSYDSSCTSDPCTIWDQSGNFASAVNNSGTGLYRIHFTVPFSGRPTCTGSVINSAAAGYPWVSLGDHVTSSEVDIYLNTSATVNTQANGAASIICQGPR